MQHVPPPLPTPILTPLYSMDALTEMGALEQNNPVNEVWHEAGEVWVKDDYDDEVQLDKTLKCFISIGTGAPKTEGMKESVKAFVDTLKNMVTQTKRSADDFMKSHRNLTATHSP
jgi:hypothetical protein